MLLIMLVWGNRASCTSSPLQRFEPVYWPTQGWKNTLPEEQGMDSAQLARMFEYIDSHEIPLHSLLIIRNGYLVTEAYWHPYGPSDKHSVESITKSVIGTLIGIAIDQGKLKSTEQRLLDFFPDQTIKNLDSRKKSITLGNLLSMTPGLDCDDSKVQPGLDSTIDWVQYFLDLPMASEPGEEWIYCSGAGHLLSAIIHNEIGTDTRTYANQNLFTPLGISQVAEQDWAHDPQRITNGMAGLYLTPRDLAKYGYLYLNRGKWAGQQQVSAQWVERSTREQAYIGNDEYVGGLDRRFGYFWSIFPEQQYYGYLGRGGQELFVVPEENLVIVFTGALRVGKEGSLLNLINDFIVPSILAESSIPANSTSNAKLDSLIQDIAGTEQDVPVLPQIAQDISNNTYKLEPNFLGWSDMMFRFETGSDEAVLTMADSPNLKIGLDNRYRLTKSLNTRPIGLRGQWVKLDTLFLDYIIFGDFIRSEAYITFADKEITIKINYLNWDIPSIVIHGNLKE
ncbi:MAG TPA: serine hydrolase [Anaerolineales bacterium]|nr:serine hydrolase [Anaerolineales bacterium]